MRVKSRRKRYESRFLPDELFWRLQAGRRRDTIVEVVEVVIPGREEDGYPAHESRQSAGQDSGDGDGWSVLLGGVNQLDEVVDTIKAMEAEAVRQYDLGDGHSPACVPMSSLISRSTIDADRCIHPKLPEAERLSSRNCHNLELGAAPACVVGRYRPILFNPC
jgi:hypothetical protein